MTELFTKEIKYILDRIDYIDIFTFIGGWDYLDSQSKFFI